MGKKNIQVILNMYSNCDMMGVIILDFVNFSSPLFIPSLIIQVDHR